MMFEYGVRASNILIVGMLGDALGLQMAFVIVALITLISLPLIMILPATPAVRHEDL